MSSSWLSSIQEGLKNAENMLNAVDKKAKTVATIEDEGELGHAPDKSNTFNNSHVSQIKPREDGSQPNLNYGKGVYNETHEERAFTTTPIKPKASSKTHEVKSVSTTPKRYEQAKVRTPFKDRKESSADQDFAAILNGESKVQQAQSQEAAQTSRDPRLNSPRVRSVPSSPRVSSKIAEKEMPATSIHVKAVTDSSLKPSQPEATKVKHISKTTVSAKLPEVPLSPPATSSDQKDERTSDLAEEDSSAQNVQVESEKVVEIGKACGIDKPDKTNIEPIEQTVEKEKASQEDINQSIPESEGAKHFEGSQIPDASEERLSNSTSSEQNVTSARAQMREKLDRELNEAKKLAQINKSNRTKGSSNASASSSERETRLSAMCERLSARLQQYKMENEQLEEMLKTADKDKEDLQQDIAKVKEHKRTLQEKENEITKLKVKLEQATEDAERNKMKLTSVKTEHEALAKEMSNSEIRVLSAAREELNACEMRLEAERKAHQITKDAALAREQSLEGSASEHATGLANMQRKLDERSDRVSHLERTNAVLEQDCSQLAKDLADKEQQEKHLEALKKEVESELKSLQTKYVNLNKAVEQANSEKSDALNKANALEEDLAKLREKVEATDTEEASSSHSNVEEVQKRLNEMTDLLYLKQAQLEKLASDKAAIQMSLEKEVNDVRKELKQSQTITQATARRGANYDIEDVVPIETIGPVYDRLAKNRRVGNYIKSGAKALDFSASTVAGLIKHQPIVRLTLFSYFVFVHIFLYFILARLQNKAFKMEEIARHQPLNN